MYQNGTELRVLVKNRTVDEYAHKSKCYIEGRKGSEYTIQYRNNTSKKQKIVVSVDGLNVMTGDNKWESGYVVNPGESINIPGWRKNSDSVAAFEFSSISGSYNQKNDSGKAQNIGVIGCRVYNEAAAWGYQYHQHTPLPRIPTWPDWPWPPKPQFGQYNWDVENNNRGISGGWTSSVCSNAGTLSEFRMSDVNPPVNTVNVGTGWGDNKVFKTQTVHANFESNPHATLLIYYDDRKGLQRRGIDLKEKVENIPNAFPDFGCPEPR